MNRSRTLALLIALLVILGGLAYVLSGRNCWFGRCRDSHPTNTVHATVPVARELQPTASDLLVAFIGDEGISNDSRAVLQMIKNEGADLVLHQGDFDYTNNPAAWDGMISDILGPDFPLLAVVGNHDVPAWTGYAQVLTQRLHRTPEVKCTGTIGVSSTCTFRGLTVVQLGVGTIPGSYTEYLNNALADSTTRWRICAWHKNQHLMQVYDKGDEVGWSVYDICRQYGAIIATAHDHSYARTWAMSDFEHQTIASSENPLDIKSGQTFAFVSGLGGKSEYGTNPQLADRPWWASVVAKEDGAVYGALFCRFNVQSDPSRADCYYKDTAGKVHDQFDLINSL
jgi:hypothetical protein